MALDLKLPEEISGPNEPELSEVRISNLAPDPVL